MSELRPTKDDHDAFLLARSKTEDGLDAALLFVIDSGTSGVPVGAVCCVSSCGETAGDQSWYRAFYPQTRTVLEKGHPLRAEQGQLRVLIVRVG